MCSQEEGEAKSEVTEAPLVTFPGNYQTKDRLTKKTLFLVSLLEFKEASDALFGREASAEEERLSRSSSELPAPLTGKS